MVKKNLVYKIYQELHSQTVSCLDSVVGTFQVVSWSSTTDEIRAIFREAAQTLHCVLWLSNWGLQQASASNQTIPERQVLCPQRSECIAIRYCICTTVAICMMKPELFFLWMINAVSAEHIDVIFSAVCIYTVRIYKSIKRDLYVQPILAIWAPFLKVKCAVLLHDSNYSFFPIIYMYIFQGWSIDSFF